MTIAEKILAKKSGRDKVVPGEIINAYADMTRLVDIQAPRIMEILQELGVNKIWDPSRVVAVIEHEAPASHIPVAEAHKATRSFVQKYEIPHFYDIGNHGICHVQFIEKGHARPGQLVLANDSHTCTYGALNCASRGIGGVELAFLLVKGYLWLKVPETIRFYLTGRLPQMVTSKDIILHIAGRYGTDVGLYKSIEFLGDVANQLSLSSRQTIANMGVEIGAKFALFEADGKTINYVGKRTTEPFEPVFSDDDAQVENEYEIDVSFLEPQVACPHDISNVKPIEDVEGLTFNQAFLGSCTNGRLEDLQLAAEIIKGKQVHPSIRMIVTPGSQAIYKEALSLGLIETFVDAGAVVTNSTCGPCYGGSLGLLASGERCISTTNRNFQGRMGSPQSEVYLASPATVAASAVAGKFKDPRRFA